jgi:hypothetical protein
MVSTYRNQRASRLGRGWRISASTCSGWWGVLCPRMHGFNLDGGGEHAASSRDGRNSHPMLESASAFDQPSPGSAESIYWSMVDDTVALTTVSAIRRGYRGFTVYPPLFSVPRLHGSFADPPSPGLGLHRASGAPHPQQYCLRLFHVWPSLPRPSTPPVRQVLGAAQGRRRCVQRIHTES